MQFQVIPKKFFDKILCYTKHIYLYAHNIAMKELDANKLFDLFIDADHQVYQEHGVQKQLDDTYTLFGTVIRGVENYYIIDQMYTNRYGERYTSIREKLRVKYLSNLVRYLGRIDDIHSDTVNTFIGEFGHQSINYALNELIDCFVEIEQYEKCAVIHKFIEKFKVNNLHTTH